MTVISLSLRNDGADYRFEMKGLFGMKVILRGRTLISKGKWICYGLIADLSAVTLVSI